MGTKPEVTKPKRSRSFGQITKLKKIAKALNFWSRSFGLKCFGCEAEAASYPCLVDLCPFSPIKLSLQTKKELSNFRPEQTLTWSPWVGGKRQYWVSDLQNKKLIDCMHAIIHKCPLITDTQTMTLYWLTVQAWERWRTDSRTASLSYAVDKKNAWPKCDRNKLNNIRGLL